MNFSNKDMAGEASKDEINSNFGGGFPHPPQSESRSASFPTSDEFRLEPPVFRDMGSVVTLEAYNPLGHDFFGNGPKGFPLESPTGMNTLKMTPDPSLATFVPTLSLPGKSGLIDISVSKPAGSMFDLFPVPQSGFVHEVPEVPTAFVAQPKPLLLSSTAFSTAGSEEEIEATMTKLFDTNSVTAELDQWEGN